MQNFSGESMMVKDLLKFDIEVNHSENFIDIEFSSENSLFELNMFRNYDGRYATSVYLGTPLNFISESYKVYDKNCNRISYDN